MGGEGVTTRRKSTCWICKHSVRAHYNHDPVAQSIATTPPPLTLNTAHHGDQHISAER